MTQETNNTAEMIHDIRMRDYWMSFIPVSSWRNRLDAQQALLELWFRNDWRKFKHHFGSFQTIQEQTQQFRRVFDSHHAQIHAALTTPLTAKQQGQYEDAILKFSEILRRPEDVDHNTALDVIPEQLDHPKAYRWAILPGLTLEQAPLEKLLAYFLLGEGLSIMQETSLPMALIAGQEPPTNASDEPDLVADKIIPLLGNDTWLWLQALYETWKWTMAQKRNEEYPFKKGMTLSQKASLMRRLVGYQRKTSRLSLANDRYPFRPMPSLSDKDREIFEKKLKAVAEELEEAHRRQERISISEILEPFRQKNEWFCQDLFVYLLKNPLYFFDFLQIPQNASISERPLRKGISTEAFLQGVEEVGKYLSYNATGSPEDYKNFYGWLTEHAAILNDISLALEWEIHDHSRSIDFKSFSSWLDEASYELKRLISSWGSNFNFYNLTCIRDFMASWMDGEIFAPSLHDFAMIAITRESLSPFESFAREQLDKSIDELAYWDILRRPSVYLLARLYEEGVFKHIEALSKPDKPEMKTTLNTFERKSLEDLCKEMVQDEYGLNPYAFNQQHNGVKYKAFWFLEDWPEYRNMVDVRVKPDAIQLAIMNKEAIVIPADKNMEEAIYERFAPDGVSTERMEKLAKELIPIPPELDLLLKKDGETLTKSFISKVLDYAESQGIATQDLKLALNKPDQAQKPEPLLSNHVKMPKTSNSLASSDMSPLQMPSPQDFPTLLGSTDLGTTYKGKLMWIWERLNHKCSYTEYFNEFPGSESEPRTLASRVNASISRIGYQLKNGNRKLSIVVL